MALRLAKRFKLLRGLAYKEDAIELAKEKLRREENLHGQLGGRVQAQVTREGLSRVLASSDGGGLAALLGVSGGNEVDSIIQMFDADNSGELDAEESQMLVDMIKKRAAMGASKPYEAQRALHAWPLQEPPPTAAQARAIVLEHYARSNARPLYAPGEVTLTARVEKLAEQSSVLAQMVAEHNTSTVKAIDELDAMLELVSMHVRNELTIVDRVSAVGGELSRLPAMLATRERAEVLRDPTLPILASRSSAAAGGRRRVPS